MRKVLFILGQLNDADADWLSAHGTRQRVAKGTELIRQGTRIDTVYIVLDGAMVVMAGHGVRLAQVTSGDILGEMSLVDSAPTAASVVVEQDAVVLAIAREALNAKLQEDIGFAARFYRALALFLADRMRSTISRLGYGKDEPASFDRIDQDELDASVLDTVHLAGARFERMLKRLAG